MESVVPRKPADPSVSTPAHFQQVIEWLEECLHQHEHCPSPLNSSGQFDPPSLPVRVLDCGPPNGNPEDKVKLLISNGKRDTYVALSYCWGRTLQLRTLKNNIDSHVKDGIQMDKLPKTIQDAIHVTRNLKIRYLWIDSLCIIQDSLDDDWPREAAKMPEIYKNAFATISAASANDCAQGFLEDREAIKVAASQGLFLPLLKENGLGVKSQVSSLFLLIDSELGHRKKDFEEEPINTRAWTLQESWLAPRLVVYGSGLLHYRCLTAQHTYGLTNEDSEDDEDDEDNCRRRFFTSGNEKNQHNSLSSPNPINRELSDDEYYLLREWYSLFTGYTQRSLTKQSDKFPAVSGIAKEFHRLLGDEYVAGLWSRTLPHSLLWRHDERDNEAEPSVNSQSAEATRSLVSSSENLGTNWSSSTREANVYIAPSWSPMQNNGPVVPEYPNERPGHTLAAVQNFSTTLANVHAPFGAITSGRIEIKAPVALFSLAQLAEHFVVYVDGSPHIYWDYIIPDGGKRNHYLSHAANLQRTNPNLNPQAQITQILTNSASVEEPQEERGDRPTPPDWIERPTRDMFRSNQPRLASEAPEDVTYFLLEITHTTLPRGLVLVNLHDNVYKRIGMFSMGRDLGARTNDPAALRIAGRRQWDWDSMLSMRTCVII